MFQRLRKILLSTPVVVLAVLLALYLAIGFLALPALLKWQAEKQVRDTLGQRLEIGQIRFNPLSFQFEVDGLALSDAQGRPMLGWRRLLVEFDLYRSVVDRAWTFTATTLEAPTLNLVLDADGRHNFQALLDRLAEGGSDAETTALPRLVIGRIVLSEGQIGLADQLLAEPVVARIQPLALEIDALSTLAGQPARYRLTATTAAGESLEFVGELSLSPMAAKGQLQISGLQVMTLVKALSRFVRIDSPAGVIEASGQFDLATDAAGQLGGTAQNMAFKVDGLSLSAAGGKAPLLALGQIALSGGRVDLGLREAQINQLKLGNGRIAASTDAQGRLDWSTLLRGSAQAPTAVAAAAPSSAPSAAASGPATSTPKAWRVSIGSTALANLALSLADLTQRRSAQIDTLALGGAATAEFGPQGLLIRVDKPALSLAGLRLAQQDDRLDLAELRVAAVTLSVDSAANGLGIAIQAPVITAKQGFKAKQGQDALAVASASLQFAGLSMSQAGAKTDGQIDAARLLLSGLAITGSGRNASLRELSIEGKALTLAATPDRLGFDLSAWRTRLADLQAKQGGDSLALGTFTTALDKLSLAQDKAGLRLEVTAPQLSGSAARVARGSEQAALAALSITGTSASLTRGGDGQLAVAAQAPAVAASAVALSREGEALDLRQARLGAKSVSVTQAAQMPRREGSATTVSAAIDKPTLAQAATELRVVVEAPLLSAAGARAVRSNGQGKAKGKGNEAASLAALSISGDAASVTRDGDGKLAVAAQAPAVAASAVALSRDGEALDLREARLGAKTLSVALLDRLLRLDGSAATLSIAGLSARQRGDRLALNDASFAARLISAASGDASAVSPSPALAAAGPSVPGVVSAANAPTGAAGLRASIDDAALRLGAVSVTALGAKSELAQLARLDLAAKSLRLMQAGGSADGGVDLAGDGAIDLAGEGLSAEISEALLRSPQDASEVLQLGRASLAGGALRLRERLFSADSLTLAQANAATWLDKQGRLNLLSLYGGASAATRPAADKAASPPAAAAGATSNSPASGSAAAPWRVQVKQAQIDELAIGFEDRRESPPLALRLEHLQAKASALDTASAEPMQLDAQATLASGGALRAVGSIHADSGALDLSIDLDRVALLPMEHYLSKFAKLQLASGTLSGSGRLRQGNTAGDAALAYEGKLAIDSLLLNEVEPKRPFLSWASVATDDLLLTLTPNRIDIGELRVDKPAGRLIIAADQSVNWSDVIRQPDEAAEKKSAQQAPDVEDAATPFPISIARLRVAGGALEFADLSLRPQFAARMHELKGVVTGLGTDPESLAKLQLDARVDRYGSAKIRGQLSVLKPEQSTDIEMAFRNLELTSLSTYVAKFAGYRIASGQLALDLQYKVKDGKLLGTNKVVLNQMVLGEKVDSPDALDLPLELAVAILKDSKGVIDIGVPVSGDLADPQFDYGEVIGKAIGNLLGGIVLAPFKALGALFGGNEKTLGEIHFEPGSDTLTPPERQKLAAVARALNERPALALTVPPTFATEQDMPALKALAVHRDIVERMGITLAADEQAGPIDVANARTQRAIEAAFSTRYAPAVLALLKRRAIEAGALAAASAASAPAQQTPPKPAAAPPPPPPPPSFYQGLVDRMIAEQPVSDEQLAQLATRRGRAVLSELSGAGGVAESRMALGKPAQASTAAGEATTTAVTLRLELKASP